MQDSGSARKQSFVQWAHGLASTTEEPGQEVKPIGRQNSEPNEEKEREGEGEEEEEVPLEQVLNETDLFIEAARKGMEASGGLSWFQSSLSSSSSSIGLTSPFQKQLLGEYKSNFAATNSPRRNAFNPPTNKSYKSRAERRTPAAAEEEAVEEDVEDMEIVHDKELEQALLFVERHASPRTTGQAFRPRLRGRQRQTLHDEEEETLVGPAQPSPKRNKVNRKRVSFSTVTSHSPLRVDLRASERAVQKLKDLSQQMYLRIASRALSSLRANASTKEDTLSYSSESTNSSPSRSSPRSSSTESLPPPPPPSTPPLRVHVDDSLLTSRVSSPTVERLVAARCLERIHLRMLRDKTARHFHRWRRIAVVSREELLQRSLYTIALAFRTQYFRQISWAFHHLAWQTLQISTKSEVERMNQNATSLLVRVRQHLSSSSKLRRVESLRTGALMLHKHVSYIARSTMTKRFQTWKEFTHDANRKILFAAFRRLEKETALAKQRKLAEQVETACLKFTQSRTDRAARERAIAGLIFKKRYKLLAFGFRVWERRVLIQKIVLSSIKVSTLTATEDINRFRQLQRRFSWWKASVQTTLWKQRATKCLFSVLSAVWKRKQNASIRQSFMIWKSLVTCSRTVEPYHSVDRGKLVVRALNRWREKRLAEGFRTWSSNVFAHRRNSQAIVLMTVIFTWRRRLLRSAFAAWHSLVFSQKQKADGAQLLARVLERLTFGPRVKARALRELYLHAHRQSTLQLETTGRENRLRQHTLGLVNISWRILRRWQQYRLGRAFCTWKTKCVSVPKNKETAALKLHRVVLRWARFSVARAFLSWRSNALSMQHEDVIRSISLASVVKKWQRSRLHAAFRSWKRILWMHQRLARAFRIGKTHALKRGFVTWTRVASARKSLLVAVRRALTGLSRAIQRTAFHKWRNQSFPPRLATQHVQPSPIHFLHITSRLLQVSELRSQNKAFQCWKRVTQSWQRPRQDTTSVSLQQTEEASRLRPGSRTLLPRAMVRLLVASESHIVRQAFLWWKNHTWQSKLRSSMRKAELKRLITRRACAENETLWLRAAFGAWKTVLRIAADSSVEEERRTIVRHLCILYARKKIALAFSTWRSKVATRVLLGKVLRRCLFRSRKEHLRLALHVWSSKVVSRRKLSRLLSRPIAKQKLEPLRHAFLLWRYVGKQGSSHVPESSHLVEENPTTPVSVVWRQSMVRAFLRRQRYRDLSTAFRTWSRMVSRNKLASVALKRASVIQAAAYLRVKQGMLRKSFWHWRRMTVGLSLLEKFIQQRDLKQVVFAFQVWRTETSQGAVQRVAQCAVLRFVLSKLVFKRLSRAFFTWRFTTRRFFVAKDVTRSWRRREDSDVKRLCFKAWATVSRNSVRQKQTLLKWGFRERKKLLAHSFARLRVATLQSAARSGVRLAILRSSLLQSHRRYLGNAFSAWKTASASFRHKKDIQERVLRRLIQNQNQTHLRHAFTAWRKRHQAIVHMSRALRKWLVARTRHLLAIGFSKWRRRCTVQQECDSKIRTALRMIDKSLTHWKRLALCRWNVATKTCRHASLSSRTSEVVFKAQCIMLRRVQARMEKKLVTNALRVLEGVSKRMANAEHVLWRLGNNIERVQLAFAFDSWRRMTRQSLRVEQFSARISYRTLSRAFHAFRFGCHFSQVQKVASRSICRVVRRLEKRRKMVAFNRWIVAASIPDTVTWRRHSGVDTIAFCTALRPILAANISKRLARAFREWKLVACQAAGIQRSMELETAKYLRRAFTAWQAAAQVEKAECEIKVRLYRAHSKKSKLRNMFRWWLIQRDLSSKRTQKLGSVLMFWHQRNMKAGFDQLLRWVQFGRYRQEKLRYAFGLMREGLLMQLRFALRRWNGTCKRARILSKLFSRAQHQRGKAALQKLFLHSKSKVAAKKTFAKLVRHHNLLHQRQAVASSFRKWSNTIQSRKLQATAWRRVAGLMLRYHLHEAFAKWKSSWLNTEQLCLFFARRAQSLKLSRLQYGWDRLLQNKKKCAAAFCLARVLVRRSRAAKTKAIGRLYSATKRDLLRMRSIERVFRIIQRRNQLCGFHHWRSQASTAKLLEKVCTKYMLHWSMKKAFGKLVEHSSHAGQLESACRLLANWHREGLVRQAFRRLALHRTKHRIWRSFARRFLVHKPLRECLQLWRGKCRVGVAVESALRLWRLISRLRHHNTAMAFSQWKLHVADLLRRDIACMRISRAFGMAQKRHGFWVLTQRVARVQHVKKTFHVLSRVRRENMLRAGFRGLLTVHWKEHASSLVGMVVELLCKSSFTASRNALETQAAAILQVPPQHVCVVAGLFDTRPLRVSSNAWFFIDVDGSVRFTIRNRSNCIIGLVNVDRSCFTQCSQQAIKDLVAFLRFIGPAVGFQWMTRVSRTTQQLRRCVRSHVRRKQRWALERLKGSRVGRGENKLKRFVGSVWPRYHLRRAFQHWLRFVREQVLMECTNLQKQYAVSALSASMAAFDHRFTLGRLGLRLARVSQERETMASVLQSLVRGCAEQVRKVLLLNAFQRLHIHGKLQALVQEQLVQASLRNSQKRSASHAFRRWKQNVIEERASRMRETLSILSSQTEASQRIVRTLDAALCKHRFRRAFSALHENAAVNKVQSQVAHVILMRREQKVAGKFFAGWKDYTIRTRKKKVVSILGMTQAAYEKMKRYAKRTGVEATLAQTFSKWKLYTAESRALRLHVLSKAFFAWAALRSTLANKIGRVLARIQERDCVKEALRTWNTFVEARRFARQVLYRWEQRRRTTALHDGFVQLLRTSKIAKLKAQYIFVLSKACQKQFKRLALRRWCRFVQVQIKQHASFKKLLERTDTTLSLGKRDAWLKWKWMSERVQDWERRMANLEYVLQSRIGMCRALLSNPGKLQRYFAHWTAFTRMKRLDALRVHFGEWRLVAGKNRVVCTLSKACGALLRVQRDLERMRVVFQAWKSCVRHARLALQVGRLSKSYTETKHDKNQLRSMFALWKIHTRVCVHAQRVKLARFFATWKRKRALARDREKALHRVVTRLTRPSSVRECFLFWKSQVQSIRCAILQCVSETLSAQMVTSLQERDQVVESLQASLGSSEKLVAKLKHRANRKIHSLVQSTQSLREEMEAKSMRIEELEGEISELQDSLVDERRMSRCCEMQLIRSREENLKLKQSFALSMSDLESGTQEKHDRERELEQLKTYCDELEQKYFEASTNCESLQRRLAKKSSLVDTLKSELNQQFLDQAEFRLVSKLERESFAETLYSALEVEDE